MRKISEALMDFKNYEYEMFKLNITRKAIQLKFMIIQENWYIDQRNKERNIMKIHYFQRYHEKENVATANTMLLLSPLYQYSSDKFFRFLKSEFFSDSFEPQIVFNLQKKMLIASRMRQLLRKVSRLQLRQRCLLGFILVSCVS